MFWETKKIHIKTEMEWPERQYRDEGNVLEGTLKRTKKKIVTSLLNIRERRNENMWGLGWRSG